MVDMVPTLSLEKSCALLEKDPVQRLVSSACLVLGPFERGSFFFQDGKDMDMDF